MVDILIFFWRSCYSFRVWEVDDEVWYDVGDREVMENERRRKEVSMLMIVDYIEGVN